MKNCFIYIRVSTDEQAQEGFSIENQKRACRDYAESQGYHVKRVFIDDGKSGRTTERVAFQEMLSAIDEFGIDCLVIYKIDRFARNVSDFRDTKKEIEAKGVEMISVLEGNITKGSSLIANILASVAEWESEVNSQRTKDALLQKFREGWPPFSPPLGYMSVGGDRERKTCEPDPYVGPIIKELFELYSTGSYSIIELQDWCAEKGLLSRNGTPLGHSVIDTILKNPFYHGVIRWNGMTTEGKFVPLISKKLFDTCQYILAKHRNFLLRRRTHNFLLRGFMYCFECGQRYTAEWHKNEKKFKKRGGKIAYYHCPKRDRNNCPSPYVEMEELEKQVTKVMSRMQFTEEFINRVVEKSKEKVELSRKNASSQRQAVLNLRTSLEKRRNKLEDNLLDGTIDRETYKRKHIEIQAKIANADERIKEIEEESNMDMDLIEEVLAFTRNIAQAYLDAPDFLKRHYIRFFYERLEVEKKIIIKTIPTPFFLELEANHAVIIKNSMLRD